MSFHISIEWKIRAPERETKQVLVVTTSLFSDGQKDFKDQKSHQESSGLSAVGLYLPQKERDQTQTKSMKKTNWPEAQSPKHPLLNTEKWLCPFGQHGLNQSLFCVISADTAISLWKNTIFLMENPCTSSGKTQYYFLCLREDLCTCRNVCRPVALRLAYILFALYF